MTDITAFLEAVTAALLLASAAVADRGARPLAAARFLPAHARTGADDYARHLVRGARCDDRLFDGRALLRSARHGRHHSDGADRSDHHPVARTRHSLSPTVLDLSRPATAFPRQAGCSRRDIRGRAGRLMHLSVIPTRYPVSCSSLLVRVQRRWATRYLGDFGGCTLRPPAWPATPAILSRMRSIACTGSSPFGQTSAQFMMVRQRNRR